MNKRQLYWALGALLLVVVAAFGLSLTGRYEEATEEAVVEQTKERTQDACASNETFLGLKRLVFQQASSGRSIDPVNFDILAASAVVRMDDPVVTGRDEALNLTRCAGRFILELPPGAEAAFGGERRLVADVAYEVQEAADGSGMVYRLSGADEIVRRLAAFDLQGQRLRMPEPVLLPGDPFSNGAAPGDPFEPVEIPNPPPAPPAPAPAPVRRDSNPSFDCDSARTRGEIMVCGSERLGTLDRRMADMYEDAMDDADRRTRQRLVRTRDNFLAYRDRCRDEACVAQAYDGRMREIRDILAAGD